MFVRHGSSEQAGFHRSKFGGAGMAVVRRGSSAQLASSGQAQARFLRSSSRWPWAFAQLPQRRVRLRHSSSSGTVIGWVAGVAVKFSNGALCGGAVGAILAALVYCFCAIAGEFMSIEATAVLILLCVVPSAGLGGISESIARPTPHRPRVRMPRFVRASQIVARQYSLKTLFVVVMCCAVVMLVYRHLGWMLAAGVGAIELSLVKWRTSWREMDGGAIRMIACVACAFALLAAGFVMGWNVPR